MKHYKLSFSDIMQPNMLYYDKLVEEACFDICNTLHIDNMPTVDGKHYFELENGLFVKKEISPQNKLDLDEPIFNPDLLLKFEQNRHNVLFVFEGEVLRGVVHLSDYNDDVVIQSIQDDILTFERNLRRWLELNGFKNENMIDFFHYKMQNCAGNEKNKMYWSSRIDNIEKRKEEMKQIGEFQLFDFKELLLFSASKKSNKVFKLPCFAVGIMKSDGIDVLSDLRNLAMHGKNPVEFDKLQEKFTLSSLQTLFAVLRYFSIQYLNLLKLIRTHKDFVKSIQFDNQSKLRIIHDHHPKALEYFISKK